MGRNWPRAITDAQVEPVRAFIQVWCHGHQGAVAEPDALIAPTVVKPVVLDEQPGRIQGHGFAGVEHQSNRTAGDYPEDKKRCVRKIKVNFFVNISARLGNIVAILVPPDRAVKMVDDAFMREAAVAILPAAPIVHPEDSIFFRYDHLGQIRIACWQIVIFHWHDMLVDGCVCGRRHRQVNGK